MVERLGPPDNSAQERSFGPGDLVLVMDTSFLIRLSNRDLWARNVWLGAPRMAREQGKRFQFFVSYEVINEYENMRQTDRRDDYGLPLAHHALEELFNESLTDILLPQEPSAFAAAKAAWLNYISLRFKPESHRIRRGIFPTDLSVTGYARTIAQQGAQVWLASYDLRDVIHPTVYDAEQIAREKLEITPIAPHPIDIKCFEGTRYTTPNGHLPPVLTREVVADLQMSRLDLGAFTYIILEKDVHSGNATFDVAVGVEEFRNEQQARVPGVYRNSEGKFTLLPAIRLPRVDKSSVNTIRRYFRRSNPNLPYRLVVIENLNPFFPVLIAPSGKSDGWYRWFRAFQTTPDFLNYQTDSAHAKIYFRPNTRAAKSHRN